MILFGASGLGKTHLAAALGYALLEQSIRVKFTSSTALVQQLQKSREELGLEDALKKLDKYELLILDDIGYVKKSDSESQVLFELIAHRYERGSLLITTNQAFSDAHFGLSGRLFRYHPATCTGVIWPPVPVSSGWGDSSLV